MTWFLKLPDDVTVDLDDISADVYAAVEVETGKTWIEVSGNPYRCLAGALALMRKVLPTYGVEMPDPFTIGEFPKWFEWVDADSLPTSGTTDPEVAGSASQPEAVEG